MGDPSTTKGQPFHVGSSEGDGVSHYIAPSHNGNQLIQTFRYFLGEGQMVVIVSLGRWYLSVMQETLFVKLEATI